MNPFIMNTILDGIEHDSLFAGIVFVVFGLIFIFGLAFWIYDTFFSTSEE